MRDDGDAAERLCFVEPAGAQRVEQQGARQRGAASRAASSASGRNEAQQRRRGPHRPRERAALSATPRPVSRSRPGVGLISMFNITPLAPAPPGGRRESRQGLPGVRSRVPRTGVEPRQGAPVERVGAAAATGRAFERRVVQQEGDAVGGQLGVALDHAKAARAERNAASVFSGARLPAPRWAARRG